MVQSSVAFDTAHSGAIHDAQLDYYGKILATASADHSIRLWNVSDEIPSFIAELQEHEGPVWQVCWSHPKFGNLLASCSYDRRVLIWREQAQGHSWTVIFRSEDHTSSVNSVSFGPWEFGLHVAAASSDGTISILSYRPELGSWTRKAFLAHPNGALAVSWGPAIASMASSVGSGVSTANGVIQGTMNNQVPRRLVTGGCDYQVRIWTYVDSTEEWIASHHVTSEKTHNGWVRDVTWRPAVGGPSIIASCSDDGTVMLWVETDNQSWKCKQTIELGAPVWKVSWSVTGTVLAITSGANHLKLYKENLQGVWEPINTSASSTAEFTHDMTPASAAHSSAIDSSLQQQPQLYAMEQHPPTHTLQHLPQPLQGIQQTPSAHNMQQLQPPMFQQYGQQQKLHPQMLQQQPQPHMLQQQPQPHMLQQQPQPHMLQQQQPVGFY